MKYYESRPRFSSSFRTLVRQMLGGKLQHRFVLILIGTLIGLSTLVGCHHPPASPLRVATNLWPGYETIHLAQNLGYYNNTPIQLVDLPSGSEEVRALSGAENFLTPHVEKTVTRENSMRVSICSRFLCEA